MNTDKEINERFKQVRLMLNMSQEEFGKAIGLSKSGVSNIENGERGLRDTYISVLCSKFSINSLWMRTGTGEMMLENAVSAFENFENYIKSIGYTIAVYTSQDSENSIVELSKEGKTVTFSEAEYGTFEQEVRDSVDYQIWKKQQHKK